MDEGQGPHVAAINPTEPRRVTAARGQHLQSLDGSSPVRGTPTHLLGHRERQRGHRGSAGGFQGREGGRRGDVGDLEGKEGGEEINREGGEGRGVWERSGGMVRWDNRVGLGWGASAGWADR